MLTEKFLKNLFIQLQAPKTTPNINAIMESWRTHLSYLASAF